MVRAEFASGNARGYHGPEIEVASRGYGTWQSK